MNRSFYNGVSGSKTYMSGMDTVANNIANVNTTGYKGKEAEFATLFDQTLSESSTLPTSNQVGLGSRVNATALDLQQGSLIGTDGMFDFAIGGDGWFAVQNRTDTLYTRNGAFNTDASSHLVDGNGSYLLGVSSETFAPDSANPGSYKATLSEEITLTPDAKAEKIFLPPLATMPAKPTENVTFKANLNPTSEKAHFQIPIIAGNGEKGIVDMTFTKHQPAPQVGTAWDAKVDVLQFAETYDPAKSYDPSIYLVDENTQKVYTILDSQTGSLTFNAAGALVQETLPPLSSGGAALQLHLGTPYDPNLPNSGYDGLTSLANLPTTSYSETHDGYEKGELQNYVATDDGTIFANFSNGKSSAVAKIPIYHFINDQGLESEGSVYFTPTANSGNAFLFTDGSGRVIQGATLHSFSLESSNVSLNHALTEMIVMQKAFDANAKSITTSDQMIQKAINMKK